MVSQTALELRQGGVEGLIGVDVADLGEGQEAVKDIADLLHEGGSALSRSPTVVGGQQQLLGQLAHLGNEIEGVGGGIVSKPMTTEKRSHLTLPLVFPYRSHVTFAGLLNPLPVRTMTGESPRRSPRWSSAATGRAEVGST